ncbi:MAG: PucR family transcriptional regulator [Candidatus Dormibacterales bacterium]
MTASVGITVAEAMRLSSMARARVAAGRNGLDRVIRSVNMMEVPDIAGYLREGELLVTTAYPLRESASALGELVPMLAKRRLAGLALKPNRYIEAIPGQMLAAADRLDFPVIELPSDASFNDVLADVLGTILNRQAVQLERSRAIHDRLTAVVLSGGSLSDLVRALAGLVQHPAAILDSHGRILASSPVPLSDSLEGTNREVREIRIGHVHHGEIAVWSDQALPEDALVAMEQATTVAALQMAQARAILNREQRYRTTFVQELVSGRAVDREAALQSADALGWDLSTPRAAFLVEVERPDGAPIVVAGKPLEEQLLRCLQGALGPAAFAWALPSGAAALATIPEGESGEQTAAALRGEILRSLPRMEVSVAMGGLYAEVADLHRTYQEAYEAMVIGRDLYSRGFVVRHQDLGLYRLLFQLPPESLQSYCDETLGPLIAYDRQHKGALVKTLQTYLKSGRNMAKSARELYVHYNTLRYRLAQIEQLTGGLDSHPTSRLGLEMGLHIRRVLLAKQGHARSTTVASSDQGSRDGRPRIAKIH